MFSIRKNTFLIYHKWLHNVVFQKLCSTKSYKRDQGKTFKVCYGMVHVRPMSGLYQVHGLWTLDFFYRLWMTHLVDPMFFLLLSTWNDLGHPPESWYNRPEQNSPPVCINYNSHLIDTKIKRLKVRGVLINSGNSLSDRHQDFPIWAKGSWENWVWRF